MKIVINYHMALNMPDLELDPEKVASVTFELDDGREIDIRPRRNGLYVEAEGVILVRPCASNAVEITPEKYYVLKPATSH